MAIKSIGVYSLFINDYCELIFQKVEIRGLNYADIRQFLHSDKYTGPTQKGLIFNKSVLEKLVEELNGNKNEIKNSTSEKEIVRFKYKRDSFIVISLKESTIDENPICVDIREYINSPKYKGFTRRGFRFSIDQIGDFIQGCTKLIYMLENH